MDIKKMLQFVKIDEKFYSALKEYQKTGNTKIIKEKLYDNLFRDYSTIKELSNGLRDKKVLDFFIGAKPIDIFTGMKKRIEEDREVYDLKNFIIELLFQSAYTNGKIYQIMYELKHLEKNSRNSYNLEESIREAAAKINAHLLEKMEKDIMSGKLDFTMDRLKWISLYERSYNQDVKFKILDAAMLIGEAMKEDLVKNRTKMIALRNFITGSFINGIEKTMPSDLKYRYFALLDFAVNNIKDSDPSSYGSTKPLFGKGNLFNMLKKAYDSSIPKNIYKLIYEPIIGVNGEIGPYSKRGNTSRNYIIYVQNSLHLISHMAVYFDYLKKSFDESKKIIEYYKEVSEILKKTEVAGLTNNELGQVYKKIGEQLNHKYDLKSYYQSGALNYEVSYPLIVQGKSSLEELKIEYGGEVDKFLKEVLLMDTKYFPVIKSKDGVSSTAFIVMDYKVGGKDFTKEDRKYMSDFIEKEFLMDDTIDEDTKLEFYKIYFRQNPLILRSMGNPNLKDDIINEDVVVVGKKYKKDFPKDFEKLFNTETTTDRELNREFFKVYYKTAELKDFPHIMVRDFVIDADSCLNALKVLKGEGTTSNLITLIQSSSGFMGDVYKELIEVSKENVVLMKTLMGSIIRNTPEKLQEIQEMKFKDNEIRTVVYDLIMSYADRNKDTKALPFNKETIDNKKRLEGIAILADVVGDMFDIGEEKKSKGNVNKINGNQIN